ncbi:MAG: hypothetical protein M3340_02155 [Actinomycetota bacterium]|nr:hypothetical protein [Actinomycetota bacterium]
MKRTCNTCGAAFVPRFREQRRCDLHQGNSTGWSHNRDRAAQARLREQVLERDGYRCTHVEHGKRCTVTDPKRLRAAHLVPLAEGGGYDPDEATTLCEEHDRLTDSKAR